MILCLGATPAAQRVLVFPKLQIDAVNRARETFETASGKSINVAKVLKTLGADPVATGFVGGNQGEQIIQRLKERGIASVFVKVAAATRQCTSVVDESNGTVTELVEESRRVAPEDYQDLLAIIENHMSKCLAVVQSGSLTPGGPVDFYRRVTTVAASHDVLSVVDAQGPSLVAALEAKPGLVKPNRTELGATVGRTLENEREVIEAMREVRVRGAARVVVTAGPGAILAMDEKGLWKIQSIPITALNPIGSGDAFTAALTWRLTLGDSLAEACRWGAAAGAANALSYLPGELMKSDVERLYQRTELNQL